jgi:NAD(P)-dependent dehydrogenase (short-subunit alcohol dehydrogenase family)
MINGVMAERTAGRTALVTGANRGIGFEVCRQLGRLGLRIVLTARDPERGRRATARLVAEKLDVRFAVMDVSDRAAVVSCAERVREAGVHVDVLVNNAGEYPTGPVLRTTPEVFRRTLDTNFFGAVWTCQAFVPAMVRAGYGRVVNVSSGYGAFAEELEGPAAAYSISKAALNALTLKLATEVRGDVKVNAVCPGWVRTRMGGPGATVPVEEGADTIVWLATLPAGGPNGGFFRARRRIAW